MKLLSYAIGGAESWGAVTDAGVVDLAQAVPACPTLADFIGSPDFEQRDALLAGRSGAVIPLHDIRFLPVIPRPEKIVCVLRNYHEPDAGPDALPPPAFPPIFLRVWRSQVGHLAPVIRPRVSTQLDFEGELAVMIGKAGRHIPAETALDHVAGYSIYNDVSVRDWQRHAQQIASGKNFIGTGPFGPWMVTADEIPNPSGLALSTRLNGETVQSSDTSRLIFDVPALIAYCSTIFDLVPGDVIVTGTPGGAGFTRKPPLYLKPGDRVEVEIARIGTLSNDVIDE
ncbi:fumarylacetoacetate (FAA) hydrolase family protein [Azorhizobium caulinodans ORS 571]|uniref:Fumarylacetoacetate (FAA) hydrolase family protein n=1 Tax=Azorhizobium caulinodans (strain ATCC 43989 / DSM 5975 / JCM 20966 / LMG 6465 / NBRC 14845 / NCIMB 13405 / ORS 571) TaxID=438753 RepID=A8I2J1_AZOC5|nr:fumarylacetoacetate hydrolase family protein [Azorhizobium caulinodans]BAF87881.1 fumarylacetoacetate (FAA) hydrolase family protein [Azorhizobium caulinodans ORS 571]